MRHASNRGASTAGSKPIAAAEARCRLRLRCMHHTSCLACMLTTTLGALSSVHTCRHTVNADSIIRDACSRLRLVSPADHVSWSCPVQLLSYLMRGAPCSACCNLRTPTFVMAATSALLVRHAGRSVVSSWQPQSAMRHSSDCSYQPCYT